MSSFQEKYTRLNKEQKKAVDLIDGPLLILAGPGTGKTQLLSVRAANIINSGKAKPENILILTFTNAAAREMRDRLAAIVGNEGYSVEVETFHSFANSIVLESEEAVKYVKDKIEISEVEKVKAIEYILDNVKSAEPLRPFGSPYIHRPEIETRISELKNEGISPQEFRKTLKTLKPDGVRIEEKDIARLNALAAVYESYEGLKDAEPGKLFDERGRIDYDDMILVALLALKNDKGLREILRDQYRYIMVDEYQDTNGAQLELLFSILDADVPNICCVGDDDQAIFRFQGATLSNFRTLRERLPSLTTITLSENYRSTADIIALSGKIISQLPPKERMAVKSLKACRSYAKETIRFLEFSTEEEELSFIVEEIRREKEIIKSDRTLSGDERDAPYNNIAVLVRKRAHMIKLIDAFLKAGIPYATDGGEDIRQEKRVRQMLDVLKLADIKEPDPEKKSINLYKILTADYIGAEHQDILNFIGFVNKKKFLLKSKKPEEQKPISLFKEFERYFCVFDKDENGDIKRPMEGDSRGLEIARELDLVAPHALHTAAWAVQRLITDAGDRPVHDILMNYINDVRLHKFILKRYENDKVIRIRDLRALVSFVNMVKQSDLADPALGLEDFNAELDLREIHGMPIRGELATLNQDGVRIYTAHKAKGLEFYTVFIPFSLQEKSWPVRKKPDIVPLPVEVYKSRERIEEKGKLRELELYDELRLFYVASTRAKANLIYTAAPHEKVIVSPFLGHLGMEPGAGSPKDEESFSLSFLETAKEEDIFPGTAEVLKDVVRNLTLNPTSVNNYITCARKFFYNDVLLLPGRKNQHLVFGNCAHKALEEVYTRFMESGKFPAFDFFKKCFIVELTYQGVNDSITRWCLDRLENLDKWYAKESSDPVMPLDLENKLEITLPDGIVFRGTFDKIEEEGKGKIRVIDYKTGKPDEHVKAIANCRDLASHECDDYFRQLIAYKLLYERSNKLQKSGNKVVKGVLQFLEPVAKSVKKYNIEAGMYHNEAVDLTDAMVSDLEKIIRDVWRDIQALKFDKLKEREVKGRCGHCEYDPICWG